MAMDFAKLGGSESYPKRDFDGGDDQSYGFNPAYKLQTGNLRGTQGVGYGSVKIDGANKRISVGSDQASLILGDQSSTDNSFGLSVSDGTYPRLLAGEYPDGSIKIKLSQAGYDVNTATDDQLIWSSDFNMFKIAATGTATVPALGAAPSSDAFTAEGVTISTGITTSTPLTFTVFGKNAGSNDYLSMPIILTFTDAAQGARISAEWSAVSYVQNGELVLNISGRNYKNISEDARDFRWYVFKETAAAV